MKCSEDFHNGFMPLWSFFVLAILVNSESTTPCWLDAILSVSIFD